MDTMNQRKTKNICLSCGARIRKMTDFGTHQDGSIHTDYCFDCYQEGSFTDRSTSLEDKIAKNIEVTRRIGKLHSKGTDLAKKVLPGLRRWKKKSAAESD